MELVKLAVTVPSIVENGRLMPGVVFLFFIQNSEIEIIVFLNEYTPLKISTS